MIYNFVIRNSFNEDKQFYMTADNEKQLIRRVVDAYRVPKESITILEILEEVGLDGYKLVKSNIAHLSDKDKKIMDKAREIFGKQTRRCEPWKSDYMKRHNMKEVPIELEKDLYDLIKKYKVVKVYWENGEKRGQHKLYALVK